MGTQMLGAGERNNSELLRRSNLIQCNAPHTDTERNNLQNALQPSRVAVGASGVG